MPSTYPTSIDSFTANTDDVDDVLAEDINELQDAIEATETKLGTGSSTPANAKILKGNGAGSSAWDLDFKDEDDMASNSATAVPSQQSTKAYVDGRTPAATDAATGVVELATNAETLAGTDTARAITPASLEYARSETGWIPAGETWTYASATTFTIAGDKTGKYQKGDKIKLSNPGTKYFYIVGVSYSSPNTTITVFGGNDYSLSSGEITNPFYSKQENPQGFPGYFNFTPDLSGAASMTVSSIVITIATLSIVGSQAFVRLNVSFTTGGTACPVVFFTPPYYKASSGGGSGGVVRVVGTNDFVAGAAYGRATSFGIIRYDYANWSLSSDRVIHMSFNYLI